EVAIVAGLARATLPDSPIPWETYAADYRAIREEIAAVVPGFADYESRVARGPGFTLPHPPRDRRHFPTPSGPAGFRTGPIRLDEIPPGRLRLQTVRSHDQYNTTIYGLDDRYRGIRGGRKVIFVNPEDLDALGLTDGTYADIVSEWADAVERRASGFRMGAYPPARGCAAADFPETNVPVPLDHTAAEANTPPSKDIVVRLEPVAAPGGRPACAWGSPSAGWSSSGSAAGRPVCSSRTR